MKKSHAILGGFTSLALGMTAGSAFADTASTTTAAAESVAPSIRDKITASYAMIFFGPPVSNLGSTNLPDPDTGETPSENPTKLFTKNYLSAAYKISKTVNVGPVLYFQFSPVEGKRFTLMDPYLKAAKADLVKIGNFNMAADLRLIAPVSEASQKASNIGSIASKQVSTFEIPNTRLTVGAVTLLQGLAYSNQNGKPKPQLVAYAGPNVEYKFRDNLSGYLLYELQLVNSTGQSLADWANETNLEPGLNWDVTPSINVNPFLGFPVGNKAPLKAATVGCAVNVRLL